jgi:hypothetical protein
MYAITHPVTSRQLFRLCYSNYFRLYRRLWQAAILMAVVLELIKVIPQSNLSLRIVFDLAAFVLFSCVINIILLLTNDAISFRSTSWLGIFKRSVRRLLPSMLVIIISVVIIALVIAVVLRLVSVFHVSNKGFGMFVFSLIVALVAAGAALFSSALPLVVIDNCRLFQSVPRSLRLARPYPYRCLTLYLISAVSILLMQIFTSLDFVRSVWFLSLVVKAVCLSVFFPLLFGYYLFLFADLKVRDAILEAAE